MKKRNSVFGDRGRLRDSRMRRVQPNHHLLGWPGKVASIASEVPSTVSGPIQIATDAT